MMSNKSFNCLHESPSTSNVYSHSSGCFFSSGQLNFSSCLGSVVWKSQIRQDLHSRSNRHRKRTEPTNPTVSTVESSIYMYNHVRMYGTGNHNIILATSSMAGWGKTPSEDNGGYIWGLGYPQMVGLQGKIPLNG